MININKRRESIITILKNSTAAITGTHLAKQLNVSRQAIVQDIAVLKAENYNIVSTNKGYQLFVTERPTRVLKVAHSDEEIEIELNTAINLGAEVKDVFIWHKAYGKITADLNITSKMEVNRFLYDIRSGVSRPLKNITGNYHYHTLVADSESVLDEVEKAWRQLGFIIEE